MYQMIPSFWLCLLFVTKSFAIVNMSPLLFVNFCFTVNVRSVRDLQGMM